MGTKRKKITNKPQMIQRQANPNVWCTKKAVWHNQVSLTLQSAVKIMEGEIKCEAP
jgi:hypothetical protein